MLETCKIALAFDRAKLPFELSDNESYLKRLLKEDWIGIIPSDESLAYGWHAFPKKLHVADCIHLEWLYENLKGPAKARLKRQLKSLVSWTPISLTTELLCRQNLPC